MKVLISACLLGHKVRWNKQDKLKENLVAWAEESGIELVPVCPENELLGTPRGKIRLAQIDGQVRADYRGEDISHLLRDKCSEILGRHSGAVGFIGIHGSPTCGMGVGVKNLGTVIKGFMHQEAGIPTVESNALKNENNKEVFLRRINAVHTG